MKKNLLFALAVGLLCANSADAMKGDDVPYILWSKRSIKAEKKRLKNLNPKKEIEALCNCLADMYENLKLWDTYEFWTENQENETISINKILLKTNDIETHAKNWKKAIENIQKQNPDHFSGYPILEYLVPLKKIAEELYHDTMHTNALAMEVDLTTNGSQIREKKLSELHKVFETLREHLAENTEQIEEMWDDFCKKTPDHQTTTQTATQTTNGSWDGLCGWLKYTM